FHLLHLASPIYKSLLLTILIKKILFKNPYSNKSLLIA
ncbi:MAG: hypothetical protein ACI9DK_003229, partial [Vicingaceae bacterium]